MKRHVVSFFIPSILILLLLNNCQSTSSQVMIGAVEIDTHSVATGLDTPWEILWGPDNHIWITERPGFVSRLNPENSKHDYLLTIQDVHEESESGLLGMVLHPDFPGTPYVYLVYNYYSGGIRERIVRYRYTGTVLVEPFVLLEGIPGARNHNGSRLVIDGDYKLYVTTGDAGNGSSAQDLSSLNGKILRMNLDGSVPDDNPVAGSYIWSWGHRNPQGLVLTSDGRLFSSEHGPNNDDEVNLIEKGGNYGWPEVHGFCDTPSEKAFCNSYDMIEPLYTWTPTLAVAGIDFYESDMISAWKNSILITNLKASELISLSLDDGGQTVQTVSTWFDNWFGRLRDLCISPDGRVFLAVSNRDGRGSPDAGDDRIVQISADVFADNPLFISKSQVNR
ncbi:MAG: PQQ-dependent sugar dehydrogenase [Bacteroidales bacterium]|nr:PQQ-dependent sugar dehydrogenase [Bacteroidales bacterium]